MLHALTVGIWTCLLHENVLVQFVTPSISIATLAIGAILVRCIGIITLRDVSWLMKDPCILIDIPPEKGQPQSRAFAGKVIRNVECII